MEPHSLQLGYRWSPTKCRVIKAPTPTVFKIYNQIIPEAQSFPYLGVSFNNQEDDCLRLVINGHRNCSIKTFKVMLSIPTMQTRWFTLNTKYLLRLTTLPINSLAHQLHQNLPKYHWLKLLRNKNTIHKNYKQQINSYKIDLINNATEITVQACLNNLTIHPIFKLPMTRRERRRLLRENITVMLQLGQNDGV
ncbi:hypothetical protein MUCCIDRAFT_113403 [Mucor lusitanicus CBS 277.49]|uniref:Uncharacterized protein n=1 Tax=Mucor lusitanicus CBS 277.49 TaxID=747725 RepID=A0A168IH43_MUCCL|nr:hypothetical protein MUCCIDRAFT_113403 [Mucor lusitanicus CBS 277.49]